MLRNSVSVIYETEIRKLYCQLTDSRGHYSATSDYNAVYVVVVLTASTTVGLQYTRRRGVDINQVLSAYRRAPGA